MKEEKCCCGNEAIENKENIVACDICIEDYYDQKDHESETCQNSDL